MTQQQEKLYALTLIGVLIGLGLTFFPLAGLFLFVMIFLVVLMGLTISSTITWGLNISKLFLFVLKKIFFLRKEEFIVYFLASGVVFALGLVMGGHYVLFTTLLAIDVGLVGALIYIDRRRPHFVICELEALQRDLQETFWVCRYWLKKLK